MKRKYYKRLLEFIHFYLTVRGAVITKVNKNCIIYQYHFGEEIIIPKVTLEPEVIQILFCRNQKIDAVFITEKIYYKVVFKNFISLVKRRQKQLLAKEINETSI